LKSHVNNTDTSEVLAVVPLPSAEERRRREIAAGLETTRDLVREVRHAYAELVDEFL